MPDHFGIFFMKRQRTFRLAALGRDQGKTSEPAFNEIRKTNFV
jgi:hypothetical protein